MWIRTDDELFFSKNFRLNQYANGVYITTTMYTMPKSIAVPDYETGEKIMEMITAAIETGETVFDARRALAQIAQSR